MPTPTKGPRLGGSPTHERMILASLASQLFEHGRITTTETKAKRMRPLVEKLITKAKRGDLHARRMVLATIHDKGVVHKLFTEIAPTMAEREGGYVRIIKTGNRKGDNAPMAVIELVTESLEEGRAAKAKQAKRSGAASRPARPAADAQSTENVAPTPEEAAATPVSDEPLDATPAATEQAVEAEKMPETTEVDANTTETTGPVATEADDPAK